MDGFRVALNLNNNKSDNKEKIKNTEELKNEELKNQVNNTGRGKNKPIIKTNLQRYVENTNELNKYKPITKH